MYCILGTKNAARIRSFFRCPSFYFWQTEPGLLIRFLVQVNLAKNVAFLSESRQRLLQDLVYFPCSCTHFCRCSCIAFSLFLCSLWTMFWNSSSKTEALSNTIYKACSSFSHSNRRSECVFLFSHSLFSFWKTEPGPIIRFLVQVALSDVCCCWFSTLRSFRFRCFLSILLLSLFSAWFFHLPTSKLFPMSDDEPDRPKRKEKKPSWKTYPNNSWNNQTGFWHFRPRPWWLSFTNDLRVVMLLLGEKLTEEEIQQMVRFSLAVCSLVWSLVVLFLFAFRVIKLILTGCDSLIHFFFLFLIFPDFFLRTFRVGLISLAEFSRMMALLPFAWKLVFCWVIL